MKKFHITVSSVSDIKFDGEATSVYVPGIDGDMEILAGHEPVISSLKEGNIIIKTDKDGETKFPIKKGIIEVSNNKAVILV